MDAAHSRRDKLRNLIAAELLRSATKKPNRHHVDFDSQSNPLDSDELAGIAGFLAEELFQHHDVVPPLSADEIYALIGEHLQQLVFASAPLQAELLCDKIFESIGEVYADDEDDDDAQTDNQNEEDYEEIPPGVCAICDRFQPLTFHHLIPKSEHSTTMQKKKGMTKEQLGSHGVDICRPCHTAVHRLYSNRDLADRFDTLDKLLEDEKVRRWANWASRQRAAPKAALKLGLRNRR
ncbi:hypothetical protein BJ742DRAFT_855160 [Cladochytrium replicatum]|nr:hypothetical protein BJ742DRAFT_855160 [Cladochytrium replicatum]